MMTALDMHGGWPEVADMYMDYKVVQWLRSTNQMLVI